tara:strand:- start:1467 stop:2222 length:756 start_codon:yes stop_codon:yes gene_type:complete
MEKEKKGGKKEKEKKENGRKKEKEKKGEKKEKGEKGRCIPKNVQYSSLKINVKNNWILYCTICFCIILLSKKTSLIISIYSFIFASLYGWFIHWGTHNLGPLNEWYYRMDNFITRNRLVKTIMHYILKVIDFHSVVHHDSTINKNPINVLYEFLNNVLTQGGFLWIAKVLLSYLDNRIIILWGLFYASVHIINYSIVCPKTHKQHHINHYTNFGFDIYDIIFGTKYDWKYIENDNHASINFLLLTLGLCYK